MQSCYATPQLLLNLCLTQAQFDKFSGDAVYAQILAASSYADQRLQSQLDLPLAADGYDYALVKCVCDIAAYNLYIQYGFNPNSGGSTDRTIASRFMEANDWLEKIRTKEIQIAYYGGATQNPAAGVFVVSTPQVGFGTGCNPGNGWNGSGWDD